LAASTYEGLIYYEKLFLRESIRLNLKRKKRKTIAIHVLDGNSVEIRAPLKCSWSEIEQFLGQKASWVRNTALQLQAEPSVPPLKYTNGAKHSFLGHPTPLVLLRGRRAYTAIDGGSIVISCTEPDKEHLVRKHLYAWYRREAEHSLPPRILQINMSFADSVKVPRLVVEKMSASWGRCDGKSEIRINSLIMRESLEAIDFVLTHELCHLRHFRHDKNFYDLLSEIMPDWQARERMLTRR